MSTTMLDDIFPSGFSPCKFNLTVKSSEAFIVAGLYPPANSKIDSPHKNNTSRVIGGAQGNFKFNWIDILPTMPLGLCQDVNLKKMHRHVMQSRILSDWHTRILTEVIAGSRVVYVAGKTCNVAWEKCAWGTKTVICPDLGVFQYIGEYGQFIAVLGRKHPTAHILSRRPEDFEEFKTTMSLLNMLMTCSPGDVSATMLTMSISLTATQRLQGFQHVQNNILQVDTWPKTMVHLKNLSWEHQTNIEFMTSIVHICGTDSSAVGKIMCHIPAYLIGDGVLQCIKQCVEDWSLPTFQKIVCNGFFSQWSTQGAGFIVEVKRLIKDWSLHIFQKIVCDGFFSQWSTQGARFIVEAKELIKVWSLPIFQNIVCDGFFSQWSTQGARFIVEVKGLIKVWSLPTFQMIVCGGFFSQWSTQGARFIVEVNELIKVWSLPTFQKIVCGGFFSQWSTQGARFMVEVKELIKVWSLPTFQKIVCNGFFSQWSTQGARFIDEVKELIKVWNLPMFQKIVCGGFFSQWSTQGARFMVEVKELIKVWSLATFQKIVCNGFFSQWSTQGAGFIVEVKNLIKECGLVLFAKISNNSFFSHYFGKNKIVFRARWFEWRTKYDEPIPFSRTVVASRIIVNGFWENFMTLSQHAACEDAWDMWLNISVNDFLMAQCIYNVKDKMKVSWMFDIITTQHHHQWQVLLGGSYGTSKKRCTEHLITLAKDTVASTTSSTSSSSSSSE